jgi:5'-nucleotidase
MKKNKPHILLTNDDGIRSPGLWAAASELSKIGFVTVVAPREQSTAMGRSLPSTSDGRIYQEQMQVAGQEWSVYAVNGSPAQAVQYGILEIAPQKPDLVVAGINYGENVGLGITISGTVGAAMQASAMGCPALAMSLETDPEHHLTYSEEIDFTAAGYFTNMFAKLLLEKKNFNGVDLLKVEIPRQATLQTEWQVARLSHLLYYHPVLTKRDSLTEPGVISYVRDNEMLNEPEDTDIYVLRKKQKVAVTPLVLDMTAKVNLQEFENYLRK